MTGGSWDTVRVCEVASLLQRGRRGGRHGARRRDGSVGRETVAGQWISETLAADAIRILKLIHCPVSTTHASFVYRANGSRPMTGKITDAKLSPERSPFASIMGSSSPTTVSKKSLDFATENVLYHSSGCKCALFQSYVTVTFQIFQKNLNLSYS